MTFRRLVAAAVAAFLGAVLLAPGAAASTHGSGGPASDLLRQSFTASNGLSSQYHLFGAGVPTNRPVGLLLQFHGDGAYEFHNPSSSYSLGGSSGIVAQAKSRGMLTIAALSPDKQGSVTWWEQGGANADYVRDLVQKVAYDRYDIDTSNVWLVGYSGGAQFITQFFLPKHSSMIDGGGSVVFGGGGTPRVPVTPFASGLTQKFWMHWYTGLEDDGRGGSYNALRDARAGSEYYAGRSFRTSLETPAGVGHGGLPFGKVVGQQLSAHAAAPVTSTVPVSVPVTAPVAAPAPAPAPAPVATPPAAPAAGVKHTLTPSRYGASVTLDVPAGTKRTTLRVSKSPFGAQTGWYVYTTRTGKGLTLTLRSGLSPATRYYYQVESGTNRTVLASGTFTTAR
jgi:hypothetical protein